MLKRGQNFKWLKKTVKTINKDFWAGMMSGIVLTAAVVFVALKLSSSNQLAVPKNSACSEICVQNYLSCIDNCSEKDNLCLRYCWEDKSTCYSRCK